MKITEISGRVPAGAETYMPEMTRVGAETFMKSHPLMPFLEFYDMVGDAAYVQRDSDASGGIGRVKGTDFSAGNERETTRYRHSRFLATQSRLIKRSNVAAKTLHLWLTGFWSLLLCTRRGILLRSLSMGPYQHRCGTVSQRCALLGKKTRLQ